MSPEDAELLEYFFIAIKPLVVRAEPFSNTVKRKLAKFSETDKGEQTYNLAAYLIAQLGKNYNDRAIGRIESYGFKQFDTGQTVSKESELYELVQLLRVV